MNDRLLNRKLRSVEVGDKSISALLEAMADTGFQGRSLGEAARVWEKMVREPDLTIVLGLSGSLSTTGQWKLVRWLIEHRLVDVVVSTGANVSEDIVEAMGFSYWQGDWRADDASLLQQDINRYYDVYGVEADYRRMEELMVGFLLGLEQDLVCSSMELLYRFGHWLGARDINAIVAAAAAHGVPVFCPAIADSAYGEALLMARNGGSGLVLDQVREFDQFVSIAQRSTDIGVVYLGGGVPKDFTQLLAISLSPKVGDQPVPNRDGHRRDSVTEYYYPHRYAIQITTDSPQWGGLSGCTLDEAVSWGKVAAGGDHVTCYCDATIALPLITHALNERVPEPRSGPDLSWLFRSG